MENNIGSNGDEIDMAQMQAMMGGAMGPPPPMPNDQLRLACLDLAARLKTDNTLDMAKTFYAWVTQTEKT